MYTKPRPECLKQKRRGDEPRRLCIPIVKSEVTKVAAMNRSLRSRMGVHVNAT